jgi:hypothetical protein
MLSALFFTHVGLWIGGALTWASQRLLVACIFISIAYAAGWIHRLLWFLAEHEARKLLNGTVVTCSSLEMDLLRGRYWASNVVIHSPQRETWKWEAPVLARIGRVYVEVNLVRCVLSLWFLGEEIPLELYTVQMSDIQVFIERKHNVYNFFLVDPHVILPANEQLLEVEGKRDGDAENSASPEDNAHSNQERSYSELDSRPTTSSLEQNMEPQEAEKAQQVVDHIVNAVRRAAQEGDPASLINQYRHTLTDQLKALTTKKKSVAMQEGVTLLKHVTANITEKTAQAQQVIVPARRALPGERPVYGRVGRVLIQDARIFMRDNTPTNNNDDLKPCASEEDGGDSSTFPSSWNKPILIQRVAIRANEFCPPLSAKDPMLNARDAENYDPRLPALYLSLDLCVDVVCKRVLAEMAKSDTGRFFQTAMTEVADFFGQTAITTDHDS